MKCPAHVVPNCKRGEAFREGIDCRVCWNSLNDLRYMGEVANAVGLRSIQLCVHLGDEIPAFKTAAAGLSFAKVYRECGKGHGPQCRCDGKCGPSCTDYSPSENEEPESSVSVPRRKHLAYHIYPAKGNTAWRRGVDQLRLRWCLFDGVKAVAVCQADHLAAFEEVADYFSGLGADVFPVENDGGLREVKTWKPLWERIFANANENDIAFYCHAKGVTRENSPGCMTHRWASLLYHLNLDFPEIVESQLETSPITGAFKKTGYGFAKHEGRFHYSGTFYWVKLVDFQRRFARSQPPLIWYGTECWPGMAYEVGEAACIWGENVQSQLDLYSPNYWAETVFPRMREWILERREKADRNRSAGGSSETK